MFRSISFSKRIHRWSASAATLTVAGLCLPSIVVGQPRPATQPEPRIAPLASSESPLNIIKTLANHPELSEAWTPFASYILGANSLPTRDREILILRTGFLCGAAYEWGHHARLGREAGLTDQEILDIAKGPNAEGWSSFERALIRAVDELHRDAAISDRTWAYLGARYDDKQLMDLVFTIGQYHMVSMALNAFRVQPEEGLEGFPE